MDEIKLDIYLNKLKMNTVIFNDEVREEFEYEEFKKYVISNEFIESLYSFVNANYILEMIDLDVKNNIFDVLVFIRDNTKKYNEEINEIIALLNFTPYDNANDFYRRQFLKRMGRYTKKEEKYYPDKFFEEDSDIKKLIRFSLTNDYDTINQLLYCEDDEIDAIIKNQLLTEYTLNTFNILLYDFKELFEDERFKNRVIYVLKEIRNVSLNISKKNKKDIYMDLDLESSYKTHKIFKRIKNR